MATRQRKADPKPKAVKYIALRYIDKIAPGQEVPVQSYKQDLLDEMVKKRQIKKVE